MAHIGSEVARARIWEEKKDPLTRNRCLERALDLIDLSLRDRRWHRRLKELCRLREVLADHYQDTKEYAVTLQNLEKYLTEFALVARRDH